MESLQKQGLLSEKDMKNQEFESLSNKIDASQLEARYQQLSKTKHLLFRQELKNKRIKKIKSKLYHKLKKKDKVRDQNKLRSYIEEIDPEAAEGLAKNDELKMAEERLRLRHGGHKKWARDMRRFKGKMEDKETREQYHEMIREKNLLKQRQTSTNKSTRAAHDFEEESYDSEDDEEMDADQLKQRAIDQIKGELDDSHQG